MIKNDQKLKYGTHANSGLYQLTQVHNNRTAQINSRKKRTPTIYGILCCIGNEVSHLWESFDIAQSMAWYAKPSQVHTYPEILCPISSKCKCEPVGKITSTSSPTEQ
eukprot:8173784-Ditylum_brightwellii.AAC.1